MRTMTVVVKPGTLIAEVSVDGEPARGCRLVPQSNGSTCVTLKRAFPDWPTKWLSLGFLDTAVGIEKTITDVEASARKSKLTSSTTTPTTIRVGSIPEHLRADAKALKTMGVGTEADVTYLNDLADRIEGKCKMVTLDRQIAELLARKAELETKEAQEA